MENLIGILGTLLVFGAIIAVHEFGHFVVAKLSRMQVDEFALGFGPALWQRKFGETLYALRIVPLGGYVRIAGMEPGEEQTPNGFFAKRFLPKFFTILAGATMNFVLALIIFIVLGMAVGYPRMTGGPVLVDGVQQDAPAHKAGLQPGDRIVQIDGHRDVVIENASRYIKESGASVSMVIDRQGKERTLTIPSKTLETIELNGYDIRKVKYQGIGIVLTTPVEPVSAGQAVALGAGNVAHKFQLAVANILYMVSGKARFGDLGGPVMIMRASYDVSKYALVSPEQLANFLATLATFSILIGFFNLLPLPALDGGRLASLVVEDVYRLFTGKQFDRNKEAMVHMVGMIALLALVLAITIKDIAQWIGK